MNAGPKARLVVLALAVGLVAAACGGDGEEGGGGGGGAPYKLGFVASLSGPGSVFADNGLQSAKLAIKEVEDAGILGRRIELVTADDAGDPRTSDEVCTRLVHDEKVDAIIGFQNSADREGCLPVSTREGVPYLYATPYEGKECAPNFFVFGEVPVQQVDPIVRYMIDQQSAQSWYLTGSDYVAMRGGNEFGRGIIEQSGGRIAGEEYAPLGTTDFTPLIDKILGSGADTAFINFLGTDYIAFLAQWNDTPNADRVKLATFAIPIGAEDGDVNNLYTAFSYFPTIDTPENKKYVDGLKAMFGDKAQTPSILSVVNYNAVWMWALAAQKAGSAEKEAVIKAMHEITFDGPGGPMKFNDQGHPALPMFIALWNDEPLKGTEQILADIPPTDPGDNSDEACDR